MTVYGIELKTNSNGYVECGYGKKNNGNCEKLYPYHKYSKSDRTRGLSGMWNCSGDFTEKQIVRMTYSGIVKWF